MVNYVLLGLWGNSPGDQEYDCWICSYAYCIRRKDAVKISASSIKTVTPKPKLDYLTMHMKSEASFKALRVATNLHLVIWGSG